MLYPAKNVLTTYNEHFTAYNIMALVFFIVISVMALVCAG